MCEDMQTLTVHKIITDGVASSQQRVSVDTMRLTLLQVHLNDDLTGSPEDMDHIRIPVTTYFQIVILHSRRVSVRGSKDLRIQQYLGLK
jgi:hypothetical protein